MKNHGIHRQEIRYYPEGVFIIGTYDENGVPNAMNAAWGMQSDMDEIMRLRGF